MVETKKKRQPLSGKSPRLPPRDEAPRGEARFEVTIAPRPPLSQIDHGSPERIIRRNVHKIPCNCGSGMRKPGGFLLILTSILACQAQTGEPVIRELAFGRGIVAARMDAPALARKATVYEDGTELCSKRDPGTMSEIVFEFDWREGRVYRIEISFEGRPVPLVAEASAPSAPSPFRIMSCELEEVDPHELWETAYIGGLVSFSPEGKYVAAVEYPVDVDTRDEFEEVKGGHRLHLLR